MGVWWSAVSRVNERGSRRWVYDQRRMVGAGLAALATYLGITAALPAPTGTAPVLVAAKDLSSGHRLVMGDTRLVRWPLGLVPHGHLTSVAGQTLMAPVRRGEALTDVRVTRGSIYAALPEGMVAVAVHLADATTAVVAVPGSRVDVIATGALESAGAAPEPRVDAKAHRSAGSARSTPAPGSSGADGAGAGSDRVIAANTLVLGRPADPGSGPALADPTSTDPASSDSALSDSALNGAATGPGTSINGADGAVIILAVPRTTAIRIASLAGTTTLSVITSGGN